MFQWFPVEARAVHRGSGLTRWERSSSWQWSFCAHLGMPCRKSRTTRDHLFAFLTAAPIPGHVATDKGSVHVNRGRLARPLSHGLELPWGSRFPSNQKTLRFFWGLGACEGLEGLVSVSLRPSFGPWKWAARPRARWGFGASGPGLRSREVKSHRRAS